MNETDARHQPLDVVKDRLNDPDVAASVLRLLDSAELLSVLTTGLSEFLARGDTIIDSVAGSVRELQGVAPDTTSATRAREKASELRSLAGHLTDAMPSIDRLLVSGMLDPRMIDLLTLISDSAVEGAAHAADNSTTVRGVRGTLKALRDPDVQRGMGLLVEIAKSLGRRLGDVAH